MQGSHTHTHARADTLVAVCVRQSAVRSFLAPLPLVLKAAVLFSLQEIL